MHVRGLAAHLFVGIVQAIRRPTVIKRCVVRLSFEAVSALGCNAALACVWEPQADPQVVVAVDTDAHLVDELSYRVDVSPDSAVDTLRIEVLDENGAIADQRTFNVADRQRWPLSFGAVANTRGTATTLRIRLLLFRAQNARVQDGLLMPWPETSIDRLVIAEIPVHGVAHLSVRLSYDCLGRSVDLTAGTTCVDGSRLVADARDGILLSSDEAAESAVGTWPGALDVPCTAPADPRRLCVPGGFAILGDTAGIGLAYMTEFEPFPLRPVLISPFQIDRFEYTVGQLRALLQATGPIGKLPFSQRQATTDSNRACTWLDEHDPTNDALPVNCISDASAAEICAREGGSLPSEAQWEYVARGRGERRVFPWGDSPPRCCTLSAARAPLGGCGVGIEPVGSHLGAQCEGIGDVSRDGVADLAGSVTEVLSDVAVSYRDACWSAPLARDPVCRGGGDVDELRARRGANWSAPELRAVLALRDTSLPDAAQGFRCAYPVAQP